VFNNHKQTKLEKRKSNELSSRKRDNHTYTREKTVCKGAKELALARVKEMSHPIFSPFSPIPDIETLLKEIDQETPLLEFVKDQKKVQEKKLLLSKEEAAKPMSSKRTRTESISARADTEEPPQKRSKTEQKSNSLRSSGESPRSRDSRRSSRERSRGNSRTRDKDKRSSEKDRMKRRRKERKGRDEKRSSEKDRLKRRRKDRKGREELKKSSSRKSSVSTHKTKSRSSRTPFTDQLNVPIKVEKSANKDDSECKYSVNKLKSEALKQEATKLKHMADNSKEDKEQLYIAAGLKYLESCEEMQKERTRESRIVHMYIQTANFFDQLHRCLKADDKLGNYLCYKCSSVALARVLSLNKDRMKQKRDELRKELKSRTSMESQERKKGTPSPSQSMSSTSPQSSTSVPLGDRSISLPKRACLEQYVEETSLFFRLLETIQKGKEKYKELCMESKRESVAQAMTELPFPELEELLTGRKPVSKMVSDYVAAIRKILAVS